MKKPAILYSYLVFTLLIGCFFVSCGGGSNNGTLPVTNTNASIDSNPSVITSTPTPVLIQKPIQGYIYASNITTEDGETVPCINVLDVPACQADSSGNEPFVTQVSNSLQQDYPEEWATSEMQELYAQLNKTLSESKPLPEYNAQAQLCSAYDDTSIPVGNDGHFDNTVLTGATDSNVKLEVALGEDNYAEVETLPSSGSINSSDATSAAVLKSCPEKIFAFPGEILIFKVYSEPGINLKSAGLKFTLNNSSIACITQPVYLCLFGAHKYQVAYGCVYIKPGLNTPVDTTITAKLNSGQSMNIFLEVIKKTASISGTVYTGGSTLVKGYVKSLGPKACCKIDASGNYSLPRVFMGHSRSVIATWWTSENGQKIRHREEKVIDFFNVDVTGFNFGVPPTPTPTSTPSVTPTPRMPTDPFYGRISAKIIEQKFKWQEKVGIDSIQKTVDWLNHKTNIHLPNEVSEAINRAEVDLYNPYVMHYYFTDGIKMIISDDKHSYTDANTILPNKQFNNKPIMTTNLARLQSSKVSTVKNAKMIMLAPAAYEDGLEYKDKLFINLPSDLRNNGYDVKCLAIVNRPNFESPYESSPDVGEVKYYYPGTWFGEYQDWLVNCKILPSGENCVPRLQDYEDISQYGIVYISTHGCSESLFCCPYYDGDVKTENWLKKYFLESILGETIPFSWIEFGYHLYEENPKNINHPLYSKVIYLNRSFFWGLDVQDAIVHIDACYAWYFFRRAFEIDPMYELPLMNSKVLLATTGEPFIPGTDRVSYAFYNYMMYGKDNNPPMNVREAYEQIIKDYGTYDHYVHLMIFTGIHNENDETYFPVPVNITVENNK